MDLTILFEDEALIACRKPAGVAVQTKRIGQPDMESLLKNYRAAKGEPPYIGVVHRLDQPVEGVMVFAKTKEAAANLSRQMSARLADKYYYAVTDGIPEKKKGVLEDYLLRDGKTNLSSVVTKETQGAKLAKLSYEVLETKGKRAILDVHLETGRHHQIRVQLSHAGFPIVGDKKYNCLLSKGKLDTCCQAMPQCVGSDKFCPLMHRRCILMGQNSCVHGESMNSNYNFAANLSQANEAMALCSYKIGIKHPVTHRKIEFKIDKPYHLS